MQTKQKPEIVGAPFSELNLDFHSVLSFISASRSFQLSGKPARIISPSIFLRPGAGIEASGVHPLLSLPLLTAE